MTPVFVRACPGAVLAKKEAARINFLKKWWKAVESGGKRWKVVETGQIRNEDRELRMEDCKNGQMRATGTGLSILDRFNIFFKKVVESGGK